MIMMVRPDCYDIGEDDDDDNDDADDDDDDG